MSQSSEFSDELVSDAHLAAEAAQRSIAAQIEFWAQLGRAIEPLLDGARGLTLRVVTIRPLSECLGTIDSEEGRHRVAAYLAARPYPHYQPSPGGQGLFVRVAMDGTRTLGRFVGREFRPAQQ